jgi:hypothetical protein
MQYGVANSLTAFDKWSGWADAGSALSIGSSVGGGWIGDWSTGDTTSWIVDSATLATVAYQRSHTGIYILVGALGGVIILGMSVFLIRKRGTTSS